MKIRKSRPFLFTVIGAAILLAVIFFSVWSTNQVVYVYSESCGYCTSFTPKLEEVVKGYPGVEIKRLNVGRQEDRQEAKEMGASVTPTVFVIQHGRVVDRMEGDISAESLRAFLEKHPWIADKGQNSMRFMIN